MRNMRLSIIGTVRYFVFPNHDEHKTSWSFLLPAHRICADMALEQLYHSSYWVRQTSYIQGQYTQHLHVPVIDIDEP